MTSGRSTGHNGPGLAAPMLPIREAPTAQRAQLLWAMYLADGKRPSLGWTVQEISGCSGDSTFLLQASRTRSTTYGNSTAPNGLGKAARTPLTKQERMGHKVSLLLRMSLG